MTRSAGGGNERGFSLLEVLVAGLILGISVLGLALFMRYNMTFVVGASDQRSAVFLAEQVIEQQYAQLRSGFKPLDITLVCVNATPPINCSNFSTTQYCIGGTGTGCLTAETVSGTASAGVSLTQASNPFSFTRSTCIQWVSDVTLLHVPLSPATTIDGTPANDCPCTSAGTPSNTKRVCVKVTPATTHPNTQTVVLRGVLASQPP
jgi:Tfp pilus assembly protein PilV